MGATLEERVSDCASPSSSPPPLLRRRGPRRDPSGTLPRGVAADPGLDTPLDPQPVQSDDEALGNSSATNQPGTLPHPEDEADAARVGSTEAESNLHQQAAQSPTEAMERAASPDGTTRSSATSQPTNVAERTNSVSPRASSPGEVPKRSRPMATVSKARGHGPPATPNTAHTGPSFAATAHTGSQDSQPPVEPVVLDDSDARPSADAATTTTNAAADDQQTPLWMMVVNGQPIGGVMLVKVSPLPGVATHLLTPGIAWNFAMLHGCTGGQVESVLTSLTGLAREALELLYWREPLPDDSDLMVLAQATTIHLELTLRLSAAAGNTVSSDEDDEFE